MIQTMICIWWTIMLAIAGLASYGAWSDIKIWGQLQKREREELAIGLSVCSVFMALAGLTIHALHVARIDGITAEPRTAICIFWALTLGAIGMAWWSGKQAWKDAQRSEGWDAFGEFVGCIIFLVCALLSTSTICAIHLAGGGW